MTDGPDVPGDWDESDSGDPPAALLRRAISHVESLLQRLEPGLDDDPAAVAAAVQLDSGTDADVRPITSAARRTAQAEAIRKNLRAHEQAARARVEAPVPMSDMSGEGERIKREARELSERMQAEARESAELLIAMARRDASVLLAESDRQAAEISAREMLEAARLEADRLRNEAFEEGRAEAAKHAELAAAEARAAAEASRLRALELLTAAHSGVDDVRTAMRHLIESLGTALATFNESIGSADTLLTMVAEPQPQPAVIPTVVQPSNVAGAPQEPPVPVQDDDEADDDTTHGLVDTSDLEVDEADWTDIAPANEAEQAPAAPPERPQVDVRRPLGVLFGNQRS